MIKNKKVWLVVIPIILVLAYGIWDTFSQPKIADLEGNFEEVAFVRNDQNKGGITRVYAVTVGDLTNPDYSACADMFPVNDYNSTTTILFFDKNKPFPTKLALDPPYYDPTVYQSINITKRSGSR